MSSSFQHTINQTIADRTHGSTYLLRKIINVLIATKLSRDDLTWSFNQLNSIDSSMVVIHHFLKELKPAIGHEFRQQVQQYQSKWENVNIDITSNLQDYLPDKKLTILAHSHSGVIIAVLKNLLSTGYMIDVIQTESEPGGEGLLQAKAVEHLGINFIIIKDEDLANYIHQVDCCFLGVDQYDEKSFINKLGSKAIVEIAAQFNKLVFVLGDSRKMVKEIDSQVSDLFELVLLISNVQLVSEKTTSQ
jgi:translation initiation factor 2B subunit (eIF-2B alpha/beta/delta family)